MRNKVLLGVVWFNALTATLGGLGMIFGYLRPPLDLLEGTPFTSYVIPGLILTLIVGGSAWAALWMYAYRRRDFGDAAAVSGVFLLAWLLGEIILVKDFSWLQILYFVLSVYLIATTDEPRTAPTIRYRHP